MRVESLPAGSLVPQSTYVRELRLELPAEAFAPATSRLVLIPAHFIVIVISTIAIATGSLPWPVVPFLSLVILGFTVQSAHQLLSARRRGFLKPPALQWAIAEAVAGLAVWATVAMLVGFGAFVFAFVIPLLVGNAIVMSFILTNHSLSPRVEDAWTLIDPRTGREHATLIPPCMTGAAASPAGDR
jgi:hypothetical protein